jgi:tRNA(fMet)-specific endonuclease VapC
MSYVLDTNIITAILKGNNDVKTKAEDAILQGENIFINAISYYEIKRGLLAADATSQLKKFELLCNEFGLVLPDTQRIFDMAAEIYKSLQQKGELIEDADILIASIVSFLGFTLVSNDSHFNRIQGLIIENWLN